MKRISRLIANRVMLGVDACEEDRKELEAWLEAAEENRMLYEHLLEKGNWERWREKRHHVDTQEQWNMFRQQLGLSVRRKRHYRAWVAAAVLVVALGVGLFLRWQGGIEETPVVVQQIVPGEMKARLVFADGKSMTLGKDGAMRRIEQDGTVILTDSLGLNYHAAPQGDTVRAQHTLIVPKGGEYILTLEDGTTVHVNSQGVLAYPVHFSEEKREIYLEGEAYFKVKHEDHRPFYVHTREMDVCVTGTEFNVRAYSDEEKVQTTLVEGEVRVSRDKREYILQPSQQAEWRKGEEFWIRNVDPEEYTAWTRGWFVFKNKRLEDIMNEIGRWYNFEVFYQNPEVKDMIFGGKLDRSGSVEPILEVMRATLTVDISIKGKTIVFQRK